MQIKTGKNIKILLSLFFVLILITGETAFISFTTIFQSTAHQKIAESVREGCESSSIVQLWYDPREPENQMIVRNEDQTVLWEGVAYSIVSIIPTSEDILYLCMTDNGETYVESTGTRFSPQHPDPIKNGLKGKVLLGQFIQLDEIVSIHCPYNGELTAPAHPRLQSFYPEISPPPPRLS
ncbi:MAG: hypothetical protein ACHQQQ_01760 [Bacteroidota bacterium]